MPDIMGPAATWAVTGALSAAVGFLSARLKARRGRDRDERERMESLCCGVRSLLRCELVRQHREHCVRGEPLTLEDREYVDRTYEAYHALGGNGVGTRLHEELMEMGVGR
mgnify:CR=1 FL=1